MRNERFLIAVLMSCLLRAKGGYHSSCGSKVVHQGGVDERWLAVILRNDQSIDDPWRGIRTAVVNGEREVSLVGQCRANSR